jgi:DNA repair exonuclease SbcCD ATPase subunit
MDTGIKTQPEALHGETVTVAALNQLEQDLKAELETALTSDDIDADSIISIRQRLSGLPLKLQAARITELKTRLGQIEDELMTADENKRLIRAVMTQRNKELQEKLKALEPFYERYNECRLQTSYIDNEIELLRVTRRERKAELFSLSEAIRK